jgi:RNA polymerase sigma factor (sigma-70 family)
VDARRESPDLEAIVARYRPLVSCRVRKALGPANPDWEDVVNEVLTQAITKIRNGEFRGESSPGTFIYIIASRRIIDYIRQKTRVLRHVPEPEPYPDPHATIEKREREEAIARAIRSLKPKFQKILYLYYYKDLTREEVARSMGLSPRRVSERVNYAIQLVRKSLKP